MKKILVFIAIISIIFITGCSSTKVERIDAETVTDLSGYWNDTDLRIVAEDLVNQCIDSRAITDYIKDEGKLPVIIVGPFRNQSDEHIDTSILAQKFEVALVNSGKVDFVASSEQREALRAEILEQQDWSSMETVSRLANELGADFMLFGTVKTIVDSEGNKSTRTYYVTAELIDIESTRKLWMGDNSEIKKFIKKSKTRF